MGDLFDLVGAGQRGVGVDGKWGPETEDAIQIALKVQTPCESLEDCSAGAETETADPAASDLFTSLRIVGLVVGGITLAGITAAIFVATRRPENP